MWYYIVIACCPTIKCERQCKFCYDVGSFHNDHASLVRDSNEDGCGLQAVDRFAINRCGMEFWKRSDNAQSLCINVGIKTLCDDSLGYLACCRYNERYFNRALNVAILTP